MNDNYDEEYDEDIEEEEYDESDFDQSSDNYTRPPKTGNIIRDATNRIRHIGKTAFSNLAAAFSAGLKQLFVTVISNPIVIGLIIFFVLLAIFWIAIADGTTKRVTSSVEDYISFSDTIDETAKDLYESRHSLLLLKLSEINEMYDAFMADKGNPGDIKTAMKTKMGLTEVESKKATQYSTGAITGIDGYDTQLKDGADGVRDDSRVKIITGSTQKISTYKENGMYRWKNGYVSTVKVDLVDVTVPVWRGSYGSQQASTMTLKVNVILKDVIVAMFQDIYNDPSKPVINSAHCFRESDNYPSHVFAAAVDINPDQNPMPGSYGSSSNYQPATNKLSMDANHPIVKIIRDKYGWDWGGSWSSSKDYMHFSFIGG